jgi:hypothetical protein
MLRRNYSLILMAIWLFIGVCLVFPEWILPPRAQQHLRAPGGAVEGVGLLAFVFAAYNLARWWASQASYRRRSTPNLVNPLARHHPEKEASFEEPNPALDFLKLPDADKLHPPEPFSANGEAKGVNPS